MIYIRENDKDSIFNFFLTKTDLFDTPTVDTGLEDTYMHSVGTQR